MPVHERNFYKQKLLEEKQREEDEYKKINRKTSSYPTTTFKPRKNRR